MYEIYFNGSTYHKFKKKLKELMSDSGVKWKGDRNNLDGGFWGNDDQSLMVIPEFTGHLKPVTLHTKGFGEEWINKLKVKISTEKLDKAGALATVKECEKCGSKQFAVPIPNSKDYALVCPVCNFTEISQDITITGTPDVQEVRKNLAYETEQERLKLLSPEEVEKQRLTDMMKSMFSRVKDTRLITLKLFISFDLYMMSPNEVEPWLDELVKKGVLVRNGDEYKLKEGS